MAGESPVPEVELQATEVEAGGTAGAKARVQPEVEDVKVREADVARSKEAAVEANENGANAWSIGILDCCSMRDCGLKCCISQFLCPCCTFGSAVAISGADPYSCNFQYQSKMCRAVSCCTLCCPCCAACVFYLTLSNVYDIKTDMNTAFWKVCCCLPCVLMQVQNEVMEREKADFGCCQLVQEKGGGPSTASIER